MLQLATSYCGILPEHTISFVKRVSSAQNRLLLDFWSTLYENLKAKILNMILKGDLATWRAWHTD